MFRPPFMARVAAGAAVYAIEETRRLPTTAINLPITAISQLLQTTMHVQQFVTSLALKGDDVFDKLANRPVEQPEWATFDEDADDYVSPDTTVTSPFTTSEPAASSSFDRYEPAPEPVPATSVPSDRVSAESVATRAAGRNGHAVTDDTPVVPATESSEDVAGVVEPEIATRYDYSNMTIAQLRARLRVLTVDDLTTLLDYEKKTWNRPPFVTMLTNRIATVRAK